MTQCCIYPNDHPATLLWYHDHYMGATRMNVVAGMAAGYVLRDGFEDSLYLPTPPHELPLVVQDRQLNANGTLLYPTAPLSTNGPWIGEYFGDIMLVNGKVWPFVEVEPCLYRFRVLNGCNARILNLNLQGVPMTIIGTEGGFLPQAVGTNKLVMTPAERYDVLVDFTGLAGKTFNMTNNNPPAPISTPAPSLTTVMQFRVLDKANNPPTTSLTDVAAKLADNGVPGDLRVFTKGSVNLNQTTVGGNRGTRMITLNEVGAGTSAWKLNLNATPYGATSPKIEQLSSGWDFEDWVFVNMTPDTHPMHTHLFDFEVMGRYNFDAAGFSKANGGKNGVPQLPTASLLPYLKSGLIPPDPTEMGFKDTVKANPGQVTVVRAKFNLPSTASGPQQYVHHCHIVEHEDNDMMERFIVS
jgi:spore coat protein A